MARRNSLVMRGQNNVLMPLPDGKNLLSMPGGFNTTKDIAERLGVDPFEILLRFADGDVVGLGLSDEQKPMLTPSLRLAAAMEAVLYLHPKRVPSTWVPDPTPDDLASAAALPSATRRAKLERMRGVLDAGTGKPVDSQDGTRDDE